MLDLHSAVTRNDAIKAFGRVLKVHCDGQFVAASAGMLCLFDRQSAKAMSPTSLKWTPARDYKVNNWTWGGPRVWMPAATGGKYQIFLQAPDGAAYTYFGRAHLSVTSHGKDPWVVFEFEHKLPKGEWLKAGGHDGWLLSGDYSGLLAPTELDKFDAILAAHEGEPFSIQLKRFEGDDLTLSMNSRRATLLFNHRYAVGEPPKEAEPELFSRGPGALGRYAPADKTLPRARAVAAAREFFSTGRFPDWLVWEKFDSEDEWFSEQVVTALRHLFGHSLEEAKQLLHRHLAFSGRRVSDPQSDSVFNEGELHDGPEAVAYVVQWRMVIDKQPNSMEFLDWRAQSYQRRRSVP